METAIPILLLLWGLPILICWKIGQQKHRHGFWWGLFLGWLGVLILSLASHAKTPEDVELERLQRDLQIRELRQRLGEPQS